MDSTTFWLAMALVLILEGLMPLLSPSVWRSTFQSILKLQDGQLRFFGMCSVLIGLVLILSLT
jgi:uncharacterized protein YjeT (DUF2065 family)